MEKSNQPPPYSEVIHANIMPTAPGKHKSINKTSLHFNNISITLLIHFLIQTTNNKSMTHFPLISFCSCFYFETKAYQTKRTPYHLSIIRLCTNPKTISSLSKSHRRQCRFRMEQLDIRFKWGPFPRKFLSLAVVRPVVSAYLRTITHAVAFAVRFSSFRWAFCAAWL